MKQNRSVLFIVLLILVMTGGFWAWKGMNSSKPYKETQFLMDTIIEITAYGPNREEAVKAAFDEYRRLHVLTNNFDANSQVSKINQMAGKEKVVVDPDLVQMIKRSVEMADKLDGAIDITVGPLTDLWGIGRKGDFVPSQAQIQAVLPLVNYRLVQIDEKNNTVYLPKAGMMLDLGAVAKGYATDKAIEILKEKGIKSALVNAGGDVRVIGTRPDGKPWRIGVQDPRNENGVSAKMALTPWDTMETSGDYQRYIMHNGVRYCHILDPHTGWQPKSGVASVTIVNNNSGDGDLFSTALFVLGPEKGLEKLRQFPGNEAIMIMTDGRVIVTPGLKGKVELTGKSGDQ
ncbi:FAD:protein FMN transferase [Lucifera butyrica]|nr:FAD:protein FMN transferase [Lucifera butyrica]